MKKAPRYRSSAAPSNCPSWDRTRTLLIQSQTCCQLHQGALNAAMTMLLPLLLLPLLLLLLLSPLLRTSEPRTFERPNAVAVKVSGRRGSNPRPSAWEADALPTELLPHSQNRPAVYSEPPVRIELTTARLRIECSTSELRWQVCYVEPRTPNVRTSELPLKWS